MLTDHAEQGVALAREQLDLRSGAVNPVAELGCACPVGPASS